MVVALLAVAPLWTVSCGTAAERTDGSDGAPGQDAAINDGPTSPDGGDAPVWKPVTKLALVFSEGGADFTSPRWIRVAGDGSIYIAGPLDRATMFFGKDRSNVHSIPATAGAFLLKLDPAGQLLWVQSYAYTSYGDYYNWLVPALTPDGSVILAGPHGPIHSDTPYVEHIGPDGQRQWAHELHHGLPVSGGRGRDARGRRHRRRPLLRR